MPHVSTLLYENDRDFKRCFMRILRYESRCNCHRLVLVPDNDLPLLNEYRDVLTPKGWIDVGEIPCDTMYLVHINSNSWNVGSGSIVIKKIFNTVKNRIVMVILNFDNNSYVPSTLYRYLNPNLQSLYGPQLRQYMGVTDFARYHTYHRTALYDRICNMRRMIINIDNLYHYHRYREHIDTGSPIEVGNIIDKEFKMMVNGKSIKALDEVYCKLCKILNALCEETLINFDTNKVHDIDIDGTHIRGESDLILYGDSSIVIIDIKAGNSTIENIDQYLLQVYLYSLSYRKSAHLCILDMNPINVKCILVKR